MIRFMARNIDRRIGLDRSGEIPYIGVVKKFRVIWGSLSELHVSHAYHNLLIILIMPGNGKKSQALKIVIFSI